MTGGLAHEIKNPLSTIGLNAQLLAEGLDELEIPDDAKGRLSRRLASLRREVDRLRGILQDFLDYAGELRLDRRELDVNQLLAELVDFFLPQAQGQGVRLRAELSADPLRASVDERAFKQSVLNLMLNAVQAMAQPDAAADATPRAKELIVRTQRIHDSAGKGTLSVQVIDTGPGIPADKLPRIFEPYFTTKPGGSGLGLPTTRRLIEAHGGRLDVHTDPGRGTAFTISIPAS